MKIGVIRSCIFFFIFILIIGSISFVVSGYDIDTSDNIDSELGIDGEEFSSFCSYGDSLYFLRSDSVGEVEEDSGNLLWEYNFRDENTFIGSSEAFYDMEIYQDDAFFISEDKVLRIEGFIEVDDASDIESAYIDYVDIGSLLFNDYDDDFNYVNNLMTISSDGHILWFSEIGSLRNLTTDDFGNRDKHDIETVISSSDIGDGNYEHFINLNFYEDYYDDNFDFLSFVYGSNVYIFEYENVDDLIEIFNENYIYDDKFVGVDLVNDVVDELTVTISYGNNLRDYNIYREGGDFHYELLDYDGVYNDGSSALFVEHVNDDYLVRGYEIDDSGYDTDYGFEIYYYGSSDENKFNILDEVEYDMRFTSSHSRVDMNIRGTPYFTGDGLVVYGSLFESFEDEYNNEFRPMSKYYSYDNFTDLSDVGYDWYNPNMEVDWDFGYEYEDGIMTFIMEYEYEGNVEFNRNIWIYYGEHDYDYGFTEDDLDGFDIDYLEFDVDDEEGFFEIDYDIEEVRSWSDEDSMYVGIIDGFYRDFSVSHDGVWINNVLYDVEEFYVGDDLDISNYNVSDYNFYTEEDDYFKLNFTVENSGLDDMASSDTLIVELNGERIETFDVKLDVLDSEDYVLYIDRLDDSYIGKNVIDFVFSGNEYPSESVTFYVRFSQDKDFVRSYDYSSWEVNYIFSDIDLYESSYVNDDSSTGFFGERTVTTLGFEDSGEPNGYSGSVYVQILDDEGNVLDFDDVGRSFSDSMLYINTVNGAELVYDSYEFIDIVYIDGGDEDFDVTYRLDIEDSNDIDEVETFTNPSIGSWISLVWESMFLNVVNVYIFEGYAMGVIL